MFNFSLLEYSNQCLVKSTEVTKIVVERSKGMIVALRIAASKFLDLA